jgi:outer membrane immunogenic protein
MFTAGLLALVAATLVAAGQPATAADIQRRSRPAQAPPPVMTPVPVYNWTGFYVGAHGGYAWADTGWTDTVIPGSFSHNSDGFLAGGQVGFNYQINNIVLGIEGDLSWADISGGTTSPRFGGETFDSRIDWMGTVTGRVGFAIDNWLIYGKGGFAWANDNLSYTFPGFAGSSESTRTGWTLGAGVEYGFWNNWSAKLEYNYMDFGSRTVNYAPAVSFDVDQQVHAVKLGLNYRFGGGPIAARY